jgi:hypothetical protein
MAFSIKISVMISYREIYPSKKKQKKNFWTFSKSIRCDGYLLLTTGLSTFVKAQ